MLANRQKCFPSELFGEEMESSVKSILVAIIFCAIAVSVNAAEPTPSAERDWKVKLSTRVYKIGMTRADAEKRLGARVLIEFTADHGFAPLRDVYYELDASWCAVIAYAPADNSGDYPGAEKATMKLVVQPHLVPNRPGLLEELRKRTDPKSQAPK